MFSRALKIIFRVLLVFAPLSFSFASDAPAEGHGEGEKPAEKKEAKSSEETFTAVQSRVQTLEAKVKSGEEEIQKLIIEKQHTTDPNKLNEIIRQMLTLHKDLEKNLKEYDQQRSLLKYRYPEKAGGEKRDYERIELKSIEEMETQISLGSSLKRTMKKVRSQYGTPEPVVAPNADSAKGKIKKKSDPGLTDAVILKK